MCAKISFGPRLLPNIDSGTPVFCCPCPYWISLVLCCISQHVKIIANANCLMNQYSLDRVLLIPRTLWVNSLWIVCNLYNYFIKCSSILGLKSHPNVQFCVQVIPAIFFFCWDFNWIVEHWGKGTIIMMMHLQRKFSSVLSLNDVSNEAFIFPISNRTCLFFVFWLVRAATFLKNRKEKKGHPCQKQFTVVALCWWRHQQHTEHRKWQWSINIQLSLQRKWRWRVVWKQLWGKADKLEVKLKD